MLRLTTLNLLGFVCLLPQLGCWQRPAAQPPADTPAVAVPVQASGNKSMLDEFADIARQSLGPDIDEPDPFSPPPVAPGPAADALADEQEIVDFFQTDAWREIKDNARRNLMLANRQHRVRACENINVVLIVIDDLGFGDLGVYGQEQIKTPNIDLLAQTGIRFDNYYAGSSVGTPSHCTIFTGLHTGRCRLRGNSDNASLAERDFTLSEMMFMAGYDTALFGAWKLGGPQTPGMPIDQGFEESYGYLSRDHARNYFPNYLWRQDLREPIPGNQNNAREHFSHDLITDETVEYIQRRHHRPFFVTVLFSPPRGNLADVPDLEPYADEDWPREQKQYAAMVSRVDDSVGKIMDALYRLNMKENTVVILTSDNGPHKEGVDPEFFNSNGPFNGIKGTLAEGGIRVPMIVWGPSNIVRAAGSVNHEPWYAPDLMPTLGELVKAWNVPRNLSGASQIPLWEGRQVEPHRPMYWELHEGGFTQAVRDGDWKAIRTGPHEPVKLYNLADDPGERNDLARLHPDIAKDMAQIMDDSHRESPDWPVQDPRSL